MIRNACKLQLLLLAWINYMIIYTICLLFVSLSSLRSSCKFKFKYRYLQFPSCTHCCSSNMEKVKVNPNIYVLTVRLLARNERYSELGSFIANKVFFFCFCSFLSYVLMACCFICDDVELQI